MNANSTNLMPLVVILMLAVVIILTDDAEAASMYIPNEVSMDISQECRRAYKEVGPGSVLACARVETESFVELVRRGEHPQESGCFAKYGRLGYNAVLACVVRAGNLNPN